MRVVFLLLVLVTPTLSAPVPPYRKPPPSPVWVWRMRMGQSWYAPVAFARDGYYEWDPKDTAKWVGRWELKGNILTIEERVNAPDSNVVTWVVSLKNNTLYGKLPDGRDFSLERCD